MTKQMSNIGMDASSSIHWEILVTLTDQLKLSDSKYDDAVEKYNSVAKWLNASSNSVFEDSIIYTQGSVRLGTTVKPYGSNEHDIDLVVHLPHLSKYHSSEAVHEAIGQRLRESEIYKYKLSSLKRGWRINYAGDFHLDITPAIPDNKCDNQCPINKHYAEFVPDKKLLEWKESNPRGYASWFHLIDKKFPVFANDAKTVLAYESRHIEDAPDQHEFKGVLKRTVQLLKRHRDVYFHERMESLKQWCPISIIITTLAAHAYEELVNEKVQYTAIELVKLIIKNMKKHIAKFGETFYLGNPTNKKENFAEKWNDTPLYEIAFDRWARAAYEDVESILNSEGLDNAGKAINASFGDSYGNKVLESISEKVTMDRNIGALSGIIALNEGVEAKVQKNTFYGA